MQSYGMEVRKVPRGENAPDALVQLVKGSNSRNAFLRGVWETGCDLVVHGEALCGLPGMHAKCP